MLLRSPSNYISRCSFLLPQKVQLIPTVRLVRVKENFFCYSLKRDLSSSVSKRSAHSSSVPAGLIDLASQQLDQQQSNGLDFNARTELQNCVEQLKDCLQDERDLQNLVDDPDTEPEMLALARTDLASLADKVSQLVEQIKMAMIPKASYDSEDALIEVVPGAGGLEANMFAEEIFNMYMAYCRELDFYTEIQIFERSIVGKQATGISKATAHIAGINVFGRLKFESGVHRVQRVPVTGSKNDRLHTSTCSVAILPFPRDIKIELAESDLKYEYMRASGAGGQGVNTTDSACRITHLPSGLTVECQEERSQHQNRKMALTKLRNILYQQQFSASQQETSRSRKLQIGSMNRNEKIRTYNYNRHSITDHRISESRTVTNIASYLVGNHDFQLLEFFHRELEKVDLEDKFQEVLQLHQNGKSRKSS